MARRFVATRDGRVVELSPLSGGGDQSWVAGKSWSLAAELHPDVAAAYEAAQDKAAAQIIGWLGEHATTRVGPRGDQMAVPVETQEAVTIRH